MGLLRACLLEVRAHRKDWDSAPAVAFPPSVAEACATMGVAALKCVLDALDAPCAAPPREGLESGLTMRHRTVPELTPHCFPSP